MSASLDPADDNDNEARADVARVGLVITGDRVAPTVFASIERIKPSRAWSKGETYQGKRTGMRTRITGLWAVTEEATTVLASAERLLALVEPRLDALNAAADTCSAKFNVSIWWDPAARQGGFDLPSDIVKRLAALGESIRIYFPG